MSLIIQMLLFGAVLSMDKALVQFILMMLHVLGMSQDSVIVLTLVNTTVSMVKMLESNARLNVSI